MLRTGIYEQLINKMIEKYMSSVEGRQLYHFETSTVETEEAAKILAQYVAGVIEYRLTTLKDNGGEVTDQIDLVNRMINLMVAAPGNIDKDDDDLKQQMISQTGELLLAVVEKQNNAAGLKDKLKLARPITSIAQSSLFTGAVHEPSMYMELKKEILSADRIDILVSFIKWSGLRLIYDELLESTCHYYLLYGCY